MARLCRAPRKARVVPGVAIGALLATVILLATAPSPASVPPSTARNPSVASAVVPLSFHITFVVTGSDELHSLQTVLGSYLEPGDSFDLLVSGNQNPSHAANVVNHWASELHSVYPNDSITAHVSGIARYAAIAPLLGPNIMGLLYDYEPGYEPEFTFNFTRTVEHFVDVTTIAHTYGIESVGYPTGQPLHKSFLQEYGWNYAILGSVVDRLIIQTQAFCQLSPGDYARALGVVLDQYAAAGMDLLPTFQITIGNSTSDLPHSVNADQAYACAQQQAALGSHSLFIWWDQGALSNLIEFLVDLGRSGSAIPPPPPAPPPSNGPPPQAVHIHDLANCLPGNDDFAVQMAFDLEPQLAIQRERTIVGCEDVQRERSDLDSAGPFDSFAHLGTAETEASMVLSNEYPEAGSVRVLELHASPEVRSSDNGPDHLSHESQVG